MSYDDQILKTDGCWLWTGRLDRHGYGKIKSDFAHRVIFIESGNVIPAGLELDHLCRVRNCVNPAHLEPVTHTENMKRGWAHWVPPTHCKNGHEFNKENTYTRPKTTNGGQRQCRKCNALAVQRYKQQRSQAA